MAYVPRFLINYSEYTLDKARVRTLEDYLTFERKWFDTREWPRKTNDKIREESKDKRSPFNLGGRRWGHMDVLYEIPKDAWVEYYSVITSIGAPLQYGQGWDPPRRPQGTWSLDCPASEIFTRDLRGSDICPQCGRKLIWTVTSE